MANTGKTKKETITEILQFAIADCGAHGGDLNEAVNDWIDTAKEDTVFTEHEANLFIALLDMGNKTNICHALAVEGDKVLKGEMLNLPEKMESMRIVYDTVLNCKLKD